MAALFDDKLNPCAEMPLDLEPDEPFYTPPWTLEEAVALCREIEKVCLRQGDCHVALTGGCLYKDGQRKDVDLLFYRVRSAESIDVVRLLSSLVRLGFELAWTKGWVTRAFYKGKSVDIFLPEPESLAASLRRLADAEDDDGYDPDF